MPPIHTCSKVDCTAPTTGTCLLGHISPDECEYFSRLEIFEPSHVPIEDQGDEDGRVFHAGSELGVSDSTQISRGSYAHVIALLGPYNAGKTCFLLSLYLMTLHTLLPDGYRFRRSLTLQGFEDRARKLREWKRGQLPQELADHTLIADERHAGFLHLGFETAEERFDFLFSDLPGEWTTRLIKNAESATRWQFLARADGAIIFIDGLELLSRERINHVIDMQQLLLRLKETLEIPCDFPIVLLVSKADELQMQEPDLLKEIVSYAQQLGFAPRVILCASFSRRPKEVKNGTGVFEALQHIVSGTPTSNPINWSAVKPEGSSTRPFLSFRSDLRVSLL